MERTAREWAAASAMPEARAALLEMAENYRAAAEIARTRRDAGMEPQEIRHDHRIEFDASPYINSD